MQHHWHIIQLDEVDSTNNYARLLFDKNKLKEETVVNAFFQNKGRGQQNNSWISERGKNLTFTLILFTRYLKAEKQFYLSMAVSLGIIDFLKSKNIDAKIKWPNDIYTGKGKIAGILVENSILHEDLLNSFVGIGLNVNQEKFQDINAQSMKTVTSVNYDLEETLNRLLEFLNFQIQRLKENQFNLIKTEYLRNLTGFKEKRKFSAESRIFYGKIMDVEENGQLVIKNAEGKKLKFMFKEVTLID